jgi:cytochrome c oxidase assembly protein subunit 15
MSTVLASPAVATRRSTRPVALWLFAICAMLAVMVALGGATRLTGSGLSIMEWAPLSGALPPLSHAEWERLYALYQQIPQYKLLHQGFGLAGFQRIFWLEWVHRFWGRLIGVVFFAPLVWFAVHGQIPRRLIPRLAGLFVLGGLQGLVGWVMVASGFAADSTSVSAYRLVVHLALALLLYAAILWTALGLWRDVPPPPHLAKLPRRLLGAVCVLVPLTIVAGGFVAGTHAGLAYNTFPLMDGHLVPQGYAILDPWVRNLFENVAAVQFDHRLLATLTVLAALGAVGTGLGSGARGATSTALLVLGGAVALQYLLGVATLLLVVPVALGALHQLVAVGVLTAALVALHTQHS